MTKTKQVSCSVNLALPMALWSIGWFSLAVVKQSDTLMWVAIAPWAALFVMIVFVLLAMGVIAVIEAFLR